MITLPDKINVMIVNDSPFITELLSETVSSNGRLRVSEKARDGLDAIRKIKHNRPDVILLDLEMPHMDGLTFIEQTVKDDLIPIIVVSTYGQEGAKLVLDALEFGAVDFISICQDNPGKLQEFKNNLINKIEVAARSNPYVLIPRNISRLMPVIKKNYTIDDTATQVVVIGSSTGGPKVLYDIMSNLPADLPAGLLIVQHMPYSFTAKFAQRLDTISKLRVKEAQEGDVIKEGTALLAPGDYHMLVNSQHQVNLSHGAKRFGVRPSVNMSMITAAEVYGGNTVGVLLSGMGHDGAFGMKMIKKRRGDTIAQNESTSAVFGMAKAACEFDAVDKLVPADMISNEIVMAVEKHV